MASPQVEGLLITPIGVLNFPNLFVPKPVLNNPEPFYTAQLIFDQDAQKTQEYANLKRAAYEACQAKFGSRMNDQGFVSRLHNPFRDGGEKAHLNGYGPGTVFISFKSKYPPGVVGPQRQPMLAEDVFSGQHARFSVGAFAYEVLGKCGPGFGLNNVQITKTTGVKRLDNRVDAVASFTDMPVEPGDPGQTGIVQGNPF